MGLAWGYATLRGWGAEELGQAAVTTLDGSVWGPAVYVMLYVARLALLFPATVLTLMGGYLFGPTQGTLWTVLAANLSSVVAYGIGRFFGQRLLGEGPASVGWLSRWRERMARRPFETVLILRLIYAPYDGVSILAGLLALPLRSFLAATVLGTLPGTVQFVLLGASLEEFRPAEPAVHGGYLAASLALGVLGWLLARWLRVRGEAVTAPSRPPIPRAGRDTAGGQR